MKKGRTILLAMFVVSCIGQLSAQDFVYRPINPAFGGETFNYNWLLSSAQAQNLLEDDRLQEDGLFSRNSTLEDFTESLNRQLLNQISRELITTQFGEGGLEEGNYTIGNFQIDVASTLDGVAITILDTAVGEQTQIIIPYY